jgi:hypothetical protein
VMTPNEHNRETTASNLSAFSTMALVVQLLRSVKERCAKEMREGRPPDASIPSDEARQLKPGEQDGEGILDKSDQSC